MAKKVHPYYDHSGTVINLYVFHCPGCGCDHGLQIRQYEEGGNPQWSYNGESKKPTFSPSLLIYTSQERKETQCHSFIRDGMIQFLDDCKHDLRGQTVEIPDWDT